MSNKRNIVITGFMGTGKSTVAPLVAEKLGRAFVEMDTEIEAAAGKSIAKIFAEQGEHVFRGMERELCRTLAQQKELVISTGGGTLIDDENRRLMMETGLVICLTASSDVIQSRLAGLEGRPLAASWWELYERRRPIYNSFIHQVDTTDRTPEAVAEDILALWRSDRIPVNSPDGPYEIVVESGLLDTLDLRATEFGLDGRVGVVSNTTVGPLYGEKLVGSLPDAFMTMMLDGERYKSLNTVEMLYGDMVAAGADRSTTVVALGGGVVGDTAGYVAASYMRGVPLVQIPTTLLAMVDSSVGGKVGVDLPQGKNLVGAFKQPKWVLIDSNVLVTLPSDQWRCGMAEVIKHGLLANPALLDPDLHRPTRAAELVYQAVQVKVNVVQSDPFEQGERAHLNLGHTFGHAIEQVTQYQWLHGDAVGVGLLAAAKLSHKLGLCDAVLVEQVDSLLTSTGLPRQLDGLDPESIYSAMATDKKWRGGRSRFVLLRAVGDPCIVEDVGREQVIAVLNEIR